MKKTKMVIDTKLGMVDYLVIVNEIALEYFNDDGEYQPHIGLLNAMRLFYNQCVKESKFDIPHDIIDATDIEPIVSDEEFISAFNESLSNNYGTIQLDFANAYTAALEIVETKKTSFERVVDSIKKSATSILDTINPLLSTEHMNKVSEIVKDISNGNLSADAIVKAYGKSKRFEDVVTKSVNNPKVVSIDSVKK